MQSPALPKSLHEALAKNNLVIVAGPGVDDAAGLPSAAQLVRDLIEVALEHHEDEVDADEIERALAGGRHAEAFMQLQDVLGRAAFERRVSDRLSVSYVIPPLVSAIAQLRAQLRAVYTTSLVDGLFNRAFRGRWPSHDVAGLHLAQKQGLIFHLRGTLGRAQSWVLTQEQETRELRPDSGRGKLLGAIYSAHHLLLVGFEPEGPALRGFLELLPPAASGVAPEHYLITEAECSVAVRRRLGRHGFTISTGDPQQLLETLGGARGGTGEGAAWSEATGECPYPGLEAFDERRAPAFFGRHIEVSQATARLGEVEGGEPRRWLAVEGPSGVGKSSFVHAGVVPALRNGFAPGTPSAWKVARMRPGISPLRNLVEAVCAALELPAGEVLESPGALAELIADRTPAGHGLLLVVDQLEEAVTFAEEAERAPFGLALAAALSVRQLYLVTTIRTDFVPVLQTRLPALASLLNEAAERYALPPISRVGLREAIVEPAAREGVVIEAELIEAMLSDVDSRGPNNADAHRNHKSEEDREPRSSETALPLVAHVLRELWDAGAAEDRVITVDEYRELGGVRGALGQSAERALEGLDAEAIAGAEALLLGLVRVRSQGGETRRTIPRDEAVALAGGAARGEQLLLRLSGGMSAGETEVRARLLVVHREAERERVDLVHEALLRDWERYGALIDRNRRKLLLDDELERRARRWAAVGRPSRDLPSGHELAELLEGAPRGADAGLQREFQAALRGAARRRLVTKISTLVVAWVAAIWIIFVLIVMNEDLADRNAELDAGKAALTNELNHQKGLRASLLAGIAGSELDALRLGVEAFAAFGSDPSSLVVAGLADALASVRAGPTLRGHSDRVVGVSFSPDGSQVATASDDHSARLWDASSGDLIAILTGHADRVNAVGFSPDGTRLATASDDHTARLWDADSGELIVTLAGHAAGVTALGFSPDGTRLATASADSSARLWDASSGESLVTFEGHAAEITGVVFSPDGTRLATASVDHTARLWDASSGELIVTLEGHAAEVFAVEFSPDGTLIATASGDHTARLWDASSGESIVTLDGHADLVVALGFSPDGSRLATAGMDSSARLWDANSGESIAALHGHSAGVIAVAFSPDGSRVATASLDHTARLWDAGSGDSIPTLDGHSNITAVGFSPDGTRLATASVDHTARLWDASSGESITTLRGHSAPVQAVGFSPDGTRLATAGHDHTARLWDADSGESLVTLDGHSGRIWVVAFSPDGTRLATASDDQTARLWNANSGDLIATLAGHTDRVIAVAFSPDGSRIATASFDGSARLWDVSSGEPIATLGGHTDRVLGVAFAPNGSRIATASADTTARLWDASSGTSITTLEGHWGAVIAVAYSPDGSHIATASFDGNARLWDASSGAPIAVLRGHSSVVTAVAFSPDGSRIATASEDHTARLWDASSGLSVTILHGHWAPVTAVAFSPDGSHIATASEDHTVRLWDTDPLPWLERGCAALDWAHAHNDQTRAACPTP